MLRENMGRLDRTLRFIAGAGLAPVGLFALGGWQGSVIGVVAGVVALVLLATAITGVCPGYIPFGISTLGREADPAPDPAHARSRR